MAQVTIEIPDKVYAVATALRQSYYEREDITLQESKNASMWIRMAEAAIKAAWLSDTDQARQVSAP